MRKVFALLTVLGMLIITARAQQKSCCSISICDKNAVLAMNDDFAKGHLNPLPYKHEQGKGAMITFATPDGKTANAYYIKATKKSKKFVFVFHEWWGLNDYIKKESDHIYTDLGEVNVLAIDLYDGQVGTVREEAQKLMSGMKAERTESIIKGAFAFAGKKAQVATLGWCSGGSWSLQAAMIGGRQVKACVMYYGMPEMDINKLKTLHTDVLGIFAEKDQHINVELVKSFEVKMKEAGKSIVVYNYVAEHAFANPSNPQYNQQATADAWIKASAYLRKNLRLKK